MIEVFNVIEIPIIGTQKTESNLSFVLASLSPPESSNIQIRENPSTVKVYEVELADIQEEVCETGGSKIEPQRALALIFFSVRIDCINFILISKWINLSSASNRIQFV